MKLVYLILFIIIVGVLILTWFFFSRKKKKFLGKISDLETEGKGIEKTIKEIRKHAQKTLSRKKEILVSDTEELKKNLKSMESTLNAADESARRNSILLSNISHTLRTNLNDILGFSYLLGNEFATNEDAELYEYSENIRKGGETLMHLLNNIIDISRIEADTFDLSKQNCDLTALMEEMKKDYEPMAKQKDLQIFFQGDGVPIFSTDVEALRHILSNLLDNAVKYTENGFVKVIQKSENEQVIISVKDTGTGIDKAYQDDLFEPFRSQSPGYNKTAYHGAGLGLPLVKQMITLLGGSIELESEKASGTTITIHIPLANPIVATVSKDIKSPQDEKVEVHLKRSLSKILVIDNDRLNNMLVKKMLPQVSQLFFATNKKELDTIIQKSGSTGEPFDIVIMDIDFTNEKDGIILREEMQKNYSVFRKTPFVAMSDILNIGQQEKMLKAGFITYIDKPIDKEKLYNTLNLSIN